MLTLYDTSQDNDIDINDYLVSEEMARYKEEMTKHERNNSIDSLHPEKKDFHFSSFAMDDENLFQSLYSTSSDGIKNGRDAEKCEFHYSEEPHEEVLEESFYGRKTVMPKEEIHSQNNLLYSSTLVLPDVLHVIKDSNFKTIESPDSNLEALSTSPHESRSISSMAELNSFENVDSTSLLLNSSKASSQNQKEMNKSPVSSHSQQNRNWNSTDSSSFYYLSPKDYNVVAHVSNENKSKIVESFETGCIAPELSSGKNHQFVPVNVMSPERENKATYSVHNGPNGINENASENKENGIGSKQKNDAELDIFFSDE